VNQRRDEGERNPDFTDQPLLDDPTLASGGSGSQADDPASSGDEVYVPPTDPVITTDRHGEAEVLGGFATSSGEELDVPRSVSDGRLGDEAIADAVRQELRQDATTTALAIEVEVERGVVYLRGTVSDLDDADNAESVAARVPGVAEVREMLEVPTI
jgi:hypothetical protein